MIANKSRNELTVEKRMSKYHFWYTFTSMQQYTAVNRVQHR